MLNLKLVLVLVVVVVHDSQLTEAVTPAEATAFVKTVIEGAEQLKEVLQKVDEILFRPIVEYVDREIEKINVDIDGITADEKQKVKDALTMLALGKNDILRVRAVLKVLADETISRSNSLKMILKKMMIKTDGKDLMTGVRILARKMKQVLGRSTQLLSQALGEYKRINNDIVTVDVDLKVFRRAVLQLADNKSQEHVEAVKALRIKAYVGALGGAALGGAGLIITYPIAAGIAESKIKEWKTKINYLKRLCDNTAENVADAVNRINEVMDGLKKEESIVRQWESRVHQMSYDYEDTDDFVEYIDWDDDLKKEQIEKLDKLIAVCEKFKEHADTVDL